MKTLNGATDPTECPVSECLRVIGGKWKPVILYCIEHGANRFGILRRVIPGISKQVLTRQLRELEADGLVSRKEFQSKVAHVQYELTTLGQSLGPVVIAMKNWGLQRRQELSLSVSQSSDHHEKIPA